MKKVNEITLLVELILLSVPITLFLLVLGIPDAFSKLTGLFNLDTVVTGLMTLLSVNAVVSIWLLASARPET